MQHTANEIICLVFLFYIFYFLVFHESCIFCLVVRVMEALFIVRCARRDELFLKSVQRGSLFWGKELRRKSFLEHCDDLDFGT